MQTLKPSSSKIKINLLRLVAACAVIVPIVVTKMSTAGFTEQDTRTHVEIDGVNFGTFDNIEGLAALPKDGPIPENGGFHKVTFMRDFVTDPSLYLWAKNVMHGRSDLKDVHVVVENRDGEELSRYVLKYCQPLSWTVEAANPALGGFHEKIDIAVQEIAIF